MHAFEFFDGDSLAARDAHLVREQQIDETHCGVQLEPGGRLREFRKLRHETPVV